MAENNDFEKLIEKFSQANQIEYTKALEEMRKSLDESGEGMSDLSKGILERAATIAADSRKASRGDQKKSIKEIEALEKALVAEKDQGNRKIVAAHLKSLKSTTQENTKLSQRIGDGLINNIDSIGGVIAGVLADSPILAVGAGKVIEIFKDRNKDKKALETQNLERIEESRAELLAAATKEDPDKEESSGDMLTESQEPEKEISDNSTAEQNQDLIEKIPEQLSMDLSPIKEATEGMHEAMIEGEANAEQNRREELARANKAAKAGGKGGSDEDIEDETGSGGLLGFLGITKLLGGLKSMIGGFFAAIGPLFLKVLTKVFLPLAIVGSLFNGILDGFKAWKETGSIVEAIKAFGAGIVEFLSFGLIDKEKFAQITAWISDKMFMIFTSLGDVFDGLVDVVKGFLTDNPIIGETIDTIVGMGAKMFDIMTGPIRFLWSKIESVFPGISDKIGSVFTGILNGAKELIINMIPSWLPGGDSLKEKLSSSLSLDTAVTPDAGGQGTTDVANNIAKDNSELKGNAKQESGGNTINAISTSSNTTNQLMAPPSARNKYVPQGT